MVCGNQNHPPLEGWILNHTKNQSVQDIKNSSLSCAFDIFHTEFDY